MLRLEETFSPEVLEVTEELGGKAGILEYLCRMNPQLGQYILPGTYIPFSDITVGKVSQVLSDIGKSIDDVIGRSTHPDDAIAFIGGIDNISTFSMSSITTTKELTQEIENMKKKLVSPDQKEQVVEYLKSQVRQHENKLKEKYSFLFGSIDRAFVEWGGEVEAHAISTMFINNLEGCIRLLEHHGSDIYNHGDFFESDSDLFLYADARKGYIDDEEVRSFSRYFHDDGKAYEFGKQVSQFIDGKSRKEIEEIITELKSSDIPQYYSIYSSDRILYDIDIFTQDEIDEKVAELEEQSRQHIGSDFLNQESRLEKHIAHNNLRGLDQTGLYIQEHLGESFNYGTMLEHPHIPHRFMFSGREKVSQGGGLRDAIPTILMNGDSPKVLMSGAVSFPVEKLCSLYEEIQKTKLLLEDTSLQIEFASKGNKVYILQVRAFRKKVYPTRDIDKPLGTFDFESVYGVTSEEGFLIDSERLKIVDTYHSYQEDPLDLQKIRLAVTSCIAPFDHGMTEVAYYPEVAIFGNSNLDLEILQEGGCRFWSNGRSYKIEQDS